MCTNRTKRPDYPILDEYDGSRRDRVTFDAQRPVSLESWTGELHASTEFLTFPIMPIEGTGVCSFEAETSNLGTCFFVSQRVFVTAAHVVKSAFEKGMAIQVMLLLPGPRYKCEVDPILRTITRVV